MDWLASVPKVNPDVGVQRVGGRLLAAGPDDTLHTFEDEAGVVSEVGERIVELADGKRTVSEIVDVLLTEFDVSRDQCGKDAAAFVKLLVERKLLVLVNAGAGAGH